MVNYLKYEKEARRKRIKDWYSKRKDVIPEEIKNAPLRELTYEDKKEAEHAAERFGIKFLDGYIHRYKVKLDKDVTLEDAVNSI